MWSNFPSEVKSYVFGFLRLCDQYFIQFISPETYELLETLPSNQVLQSFLDTKNEKYIKLFINIQGIKVFYVEHKNIMDTYVKIFHGDEKEKYRGIIPITIKFCKNGKILMKKQRYIKKSN